MGVLGSLLITAIAYMAVPMIMMASNGGKFPKKKANKIAIWNSVIVGILFLIITISVEATAGWTPTPAFLYYWINRAIITEKSSKEKNNSENNEIQPSQEVNATETKTEAITAERTDVQSNESPKVEEIPSIRFCPKCGEKWGQGNKFCGHCGIPLNEHETSKPKNDDDEEVERLKKLFPDFFD